MVISDVDGNQHFLELRGQSTKREVVSFVRDRLKLSCHVSIKSDCSAEIATLNFSEEQAVSAKYVDAGIKASNGVNHRYLRMQSRVS